MKTLRIPSTGLRPGMMELDSEAAHYALRVHRVQAGDEVELFDVETGEVARGRVGVPERGKHLLLRVEVFDVRAGTDPGLPLTLLSCIGKGDKPEQALRDATSLGAERVVLVLSDRVQSPSGPRETSRYERVMVETARQSGRGKIPVLVGPLDWSSALKEARGHRFACVPGPRSVPLLKALASSSTHDEMTLLIGPEGGLSAAELADLEAQAFCFCSLGPFVLRAERAVAVALGMVLGHREAVASALPVRAIST